MIKYSHWNLFHVCKKVWGLVFKVCDSMFCLSSFVSFFQIPYEWYHTIFVFLWLTSLSMTVSNSNHVAENAIISFFFYGWVILNYIYVLHLRKQSLYILYICIIFHSHIQCNLYLIISYRYHFIYQYSIVYRYHILENKAYFFLK